MNHQVNKTVADALARAAASFATEPPGRLAWTTPAGSRCYVDNDRISVTRPGHTTIVHVLVGVDLDEML